jgi:hypothetical protein
MNRRHFLSHLAGAAALSSPAIDFTNSILAKAADLKKNIRVLFFCGWVVAQVQWIYGI